MTKKPQTPDSTITRANYPGGIGQSYRIEDDQAHIQNITVTDTQTGTSNTANYNNDNLSGAEGVETISAANEDQLNGGAYSSQQTIDEFIATDGTIYTDVAIVAGESYRVALLDAQSGGTVIDVFWITSVFIDLDGDGIKDANEDEYFVSSRDLSTIPESYRVDFQTYNTSSDTLGGISSGYVTAAETSTAIAGEVDGTDAGEVMGPGYIDAQGDIIDGADGINDTIHGNGGNDTIDAGLGDDTVYGGAGNDLINAGQSSSDGSIEVIFGDEDDDTVLGGWGADTLHGGTGTDTYSQEQRGSDVTINLEDGTAVVGNDTQTLTSFENAAGGYGDDSIIGSAGANVLRGDGGLTAAGDDTISGHGGDDEIYGGGGNDELTGGHGDDTVDGGDGNDIIYGDNGGGDVVLSNSFDNSTEGWTYISTVGAPPQDPDYNADGGVISRMDAVSGRAFLVAPSEYEGDQSGLIGGSLTFDMKVDNATPISSVTDGVEIVGLLNGVETTIDYAGSLNVVDGAWTTNTIELTADNFTYENGSAISDADFAEIMSSITEFRVRAEYSSNANDTTAIDNVSISAPATDEGSGNDVLTGGAGEDTIFGNDGDDTIDGGADNDTIDGGVGNDTIDGGDGDDTITGGECEMEWQAGGTTPSYVETDPAPNGTNTTTQSLTNSDGDTVTLTNTTNNGNIDETGAFGPLNDAHRLTSNTETNTHSFDQPVSGAQMVFSASANGEKYTIDITLADGTVMTLSEAIAAGHITVDTSASDETVVGNDIVGGSAAGNADSTVVTINSPIQSIDVSSTGANAGAIGYELYVDTNAPVLAEVAGTGDDSILGGAGNDTIDGECGDDTIDGGADDDVIDGGTGDDITTGGTGNDTFTGLSGNDTITDFNTGNTGAISDGDQTNNDFVDLSGYYNATTLAAWNAANPGNTYDTPLDWLRADQADDGILNDTIAGWDADNTLTIQNGGSAVAGADLTWDNTNVLCFVRGTKIATDRGEIPVEYLTSGDRVITRDNGYQKISWVGSTKRKAVGAVAPILIRGGTFSPETSDLWVSPKHRVLLRGLASEFAGGETETLAPAKHLIDGQKIMRVEGGIVEYFHILFESHEVISGNGHWSESYHPGHVGWTTLEHAARREILEFFPELADTRGRASFSTARRVLNRHECLVATQYGL